MEDGLVKQRRYGSIEVYRAARKAHKNRSKRERAREKAWQLPSIKYRT